MDAQAVALLNANNTFGQIAGHKAMSLAIDKAKQYGTGVVAVKNSNHFGIAAYYAMMALQGRHGGLCLYQLLPGHGRLRYQNTLDRHQPHRHRHPRRRPFSHRPGHVHLRRRPRENQVCRPDGSFIPLGWARDIDGKPTEDAKVALKGSLEPVGGVKGSALSLIIDIVCGILTNTVLTGGVKNITDVSGPAKTGHFFSALDISRFIDMKRFKSNVDQVIANIKGLPAVDGGQIFMPGEIEYHLQQEADGGRDSP